jgi:predicted N-acyltransferase
VGGADYVIRVLNSPLEVPCADWNALLDAQVQASPFLRHEYLAALHRSGCASPRTGWTPRFFTLWAEPESGGPARLRAACALYLKTHSHGEYVFDWAWAKAYAEHGLAYYPKALVAVPFTPVPGAKLLAVDAPARTALLKTLLEWCGAQALSSLHLLFLSDDDEAACTQAGLMLRHSVQFHWRNAGFTDFDDFLDSLNQEKRKKIRQERRKVIDAGVTIYGTRGADISVKQWDFFYQCYERTYLEHGNAPYLSRSFFQAMADTMAQNWLLFVAERAGEPIACSLIGLSDPASEASGTAAGSTVAYGRYWGALQRVDCLHFELCYYQPLQWCIANGVQRFEGGAQGEHKMARALLPVRTSSAHWLAHPAFADAVHRFLEREGEGMDDYLHELAQRSPMRKAV